MIIGQIDVINIVDIAVRLISLNTNSKSGNQASGETGLQYIKDVMLDKQQVSEYAKRFEISQQTAQVDPWAQAIKDGFTKEFDPIVINPEDSHSFEVKEI